MRIFFEDRYIQLLKPGNSYEGEILFPGSVFAMKRIVSSFEKNGSSLYIALSGIDYRKLKRDFKSLFTVVKAAGGVVKNEKGEILFIHRKGRWDLPKGKIEHEYRIANTQSRGKGTGTMDTKTVFRIAEAVREVKEETGLNDVQVTGAMKPTWHVYKAGGTSILKKTWWFAMTAPGDQPLFPQAEEDILYVRWFRPEELGVVLDNTFGSLKEMIGKELP